jgi:hypothetical protein
MRLSLKRNFAGSTLLYVPAVYWDYCRSNVMVMERIHGIIVSRMEELRARGANIAKLAENGVEIFFTQVFRHNFFHADMHPGNIFVQTDDPENPRYAAVDFGIVGTLQPRDQHYLAENFLAFFERDYARVAALHIESGWVPKSARVDELESAVRTVCEPIFNKPLKEISFAQVLLAPVRGRAPFRHASSAAARALAEDAAQYRGPGEAALSRARSVENGAAHPAPLDARAHEPANALEASARAAARHGRGAETAAAALQHGGARGRRGAPAPAGAERGDRGAAPRIARERPAPRHHAGGRHSVAFGLHLARRGAQVRWLGWLLLIAAAGLLVWFGSSRPGKRSR